MPDNKKIEMLDIIHIFLIIYLNITNMSNLPLNLAKIMNNDIIKIIILEKLLIRDIITILHLSANPIFVMDNFVWIKICNRDFPTTYKYFELIDSTYFETYKRVFGVTQIQNIFAPSDNISNVSLITFLDTDTSFHSNTSSIPGLGNGIGRWGMRCSISKIPYGIIYLPNLISIKLKSTCIKTIPHNINFVKNLRILNLSSNKIKSIPPTISNLSNLTKLNLSFNKIKSLPIELFLSPNLKYLNLSHNKIRYIPKEIALLPEITHLSLSFNMFKTLLEEIGMLNKLILLEIESTNIASLPREMSNLSSLRVLNASNNLSLCSIPSSFTKLQSLSKVNISGCNIKNFPFDCFNPGVMITY